MAVLQNDGLLLRPLQKSDRALIVSLYGNEEVTSGFGLPAYEPDKLHMKYEQLLNDWAVDGYSQFVVVDRQSGTEVGLGGIRPTKDKGIGEIGYVFLPAWWGKGIASASIELWDRWGFEDLNLAAICAEGVGNPASIRVLEKAGYNRYEVETEDGQRLANLLLDRTTWDNHQTGS